MSPANLDFDQLRSWLIENGGYAHPALRREVRDGLGGIFTSQPLGKDEVLVEIPRHLILGPHLLNESQRPSGMTTERDCTLFVFLSEWQKGKASVFYPWMAQLPSLEEFESYHPLFASAEDLTELGKVNPRIVQTIRNFRQRISEFQAMTAGRFEKDDVLWASAVYLTRAFEGNGLIPFCDFFNHDSRRGRGLISDRYLKSRAAHVAGEQVFISYGSNFDSLELWLHFGFSDPSAGTVVQCSNIKSPNYVFDQNCFIDEEGPSPRLTQVCGRIEVLQAVAEALINEVGTHQLVTSALAKQAAKLMQDRLRILKLV